MKLGKKYNFFKKPISDMHIVLILCSYLFDSNFIVGRSTATQ